MIIICEIIAFLLWINFLPPLASEILAKRFNQPLDFNIPWIDGSPLLGAHKTIRGIIVALIGSLLFIPILPLPWYSVLVGSSLVLAGDLLTSFSKRRMQREPGQNLPFLDQFLEGFLPLLYFYQAIPLTLLQASIVLAISMPATYFGAWIWNYLIFRTLPENSPRIIRTTTRLREWRACHQPLARWQTLFNFENFIYYRLLIGTFFHLTGLYERGLQNALDVKIKEHEIFLPDLPDIFSDFRILFMTDLHLDGMLELTDVIIDRLKNEKFDLCLIGGDIRMEQYGSIVSSVRQLRRLVEHIDSRHGVLGVLGNHDCIEMVPDLEEAGITMLINDSWPIAKDDQEIWLVGIDDPHFYKVHDLQMAFRNVPEKAFKIFLSHSPEAYEEASRFKPQLFLCGHTHGGQITLAGWGPIFTHSRAPRFTAGGIWKHKGMLGFTSPGVGASGVPIRFNCPGELSVLYLRKGAPPDN